MQTQEAVGTKWMIDATHSEVQFKVKHLVISTVTGYFRKFEGEMSTESEDFDGAEVNFKIDASSIDTNVTDRDGHLKSADFFDVENHQFISFENGRLIKLSKDKYQLLGDLNIKNATKNVTLDVSLGGIMEDPYGNTKAGFEVSGVINRKEFGLNWSAVTEAGGIVVGDDVGLAINVQLARA